VRRLKLKLHEIELFVKNPEVSKQFYRDVLGIPLAVDEKGLKCFDSGWPGLDIDLSIHFPGKVSISFLVEDLDQFVHELREKGIQVDDPRDAHLGMRAVALVDPDGHRVEIQTPTEKSPDWLRRMIEFEP
jgi:catechol 2,3-dioxygenase-like lactoylglutathione lyase family enzyme